MNQLSISEYNPRMEYCDLSEVNKVSVRSGNAYGFSMFYFLTVKIYTRIVHFGMKTLFCVLWHDNKASETETKTAYILKKFLTS